jgi:polar amino acid transport system substrate-binding protein
MAKKDRNLKIDSVDDLNKLTIGTIVDDVGDQLIRLLRVQNKSLVRMTSPENMVKNLQEGSLDAIAYAEDVAKHQFKIAGMDPSEFETVYLLKKSKMGYTFHKSTDPRVLEPLRQALDELRTDGTVERIYKKYLE